MKTKQIVKVLVAQSYLILCDPMNYNSPGSSVHGTLQVRRMGSHSLLQEILLTQGSKYLNFIKFAKNVYAFVSILLERLLWPQKKLQLKGPLKSSIMAFWLISVHILLLLHKSPLTHLVYSGLHFQYLKLGKVSQGNKIELLKCVLQETGML